MPRPARVHVEGALYYISCRAIEKAALFNDRADYETYLDLLASYRSQFGFKLFAFALLPEELHLCLELTNETTISTVMHAVNSRYTKYYGKRYGHTGHLFQERFKLTVVEKAPNLLRLTGYLHSAPRRSGVTDGSLEQYPWTSYPAYLAAGASSGHPPIGGEVQEVCDRLAVEHPGMTYEAFLASMPEEAWERLQEELSHPVVGSEAFRQWVAQQRIASKSPGHPVSQMEHGPMPQPKPSGPHRGMPAVVTISLSIGLLAVCTAGFYAKNVSALRQAVQAMAFERSLQFGGLETEQDNSGATQAAFRLPVRLTDTQIAIELHPIAEASEPLMQKDQLEFRKGTMVSQALGRKGFAPSKYTTAHRPDGRVIWEAVQADKSGVMMFWRGEWDGQTIRGVLTQRAPGEAAVTYSFVGITSTPPLINQSTREI